MRCDPVIALVPNELLERRSSRNVALRSLGCDSRTSSGRVRIGPFFWFEDRSGSLYY